MPNPKLETYKNKATGTVYDFTDADAQSKVTATVDLMKDTTGWIGGNKNPLTLDNLKTWNTNGTWNNNVYTYSGITYTVNTDSKGNVLSISANGTNSSDSQKAFCVGIVTLSAGDYTVSGLISDGGYTSYWINTYNLTDSANIKDIKSANEHIDFTLSAEKDIRLNYFVAGSATVSNISVYPMITTPEQYALNPSYRPYHESVELSKYNRSEANILGAKNLLPVNIANGTVNGITWVVNSDKTITVYGTATARVDILLIPTKAEILKYFLPYVGKTLIITGCPSGGAAATGYWLSAQGLETDGIGANDTGNGASFTVHDFTNYQTVGMRISIANGVNMGTQENPKVFKPMIRLASDTDSTYEPYAMTNRELTEKVQETNSSVSLLDSPAEVGNTGMITFPISDIMQYSDIVVVGYNDSDSGGNRFVAVIPTEIDGQFDVGIPFVVKSSTGVGFIVARIASNALSLTFLDNTNTNITTMYVKKIYGRKR